MVATLENYVVACQRSDIPARGKKIVQVGGVSVLIVACEGSLFAVENACPQTGRPLAHGAVLKGTITSPHTGAHYELASGRYLGGGQSPLQSHWLRVFPLQTAENRVYIKLHL